MEMMAGQKYEIAAGIEKRDTEFRKDLEKLLNSLSRENGSDTPDFILAEYLMDCLTAFDKATNARECWYGRKTQPV